MSDCIIGIDPGLDGGVCRMWTRRKTSSPDNMMAFPMPTKPGAQGGRDVDALALWELIREVANDVAAVFVESVHAMPSQGVSSTFKFGVGFGKVLGVVESQELALELVTPQRWKKSILSGLGREKSDAIRWVMSRFPTVKLLASPKCKKPHDGMAEAVCIAEFGRRVLFGGA